MRFGDGWYYVWYWSWFCGWSCLRLFDLVSKFFWVFSVFFYNGGLGEPQILQLRSLTDPTFDICRRAATSGDPWNSQRGATSPCAEAEVYLNQIMWNDAFQKKLNFLVKICGQVTKCKVRGQLWQTSCWWNASDLFFWPKCWTASNQNKKKTVLQEEVNHNSTPWSMGQKVSRKFWKPVSLPAQIEASTVHHGETNLLWNQLFSVSEDCNPRVSRSPPIWFAFEDVVTLCQKD